MENIGYPEKWDSFKEGEWELLQEGVYEFELHSVDGPHTKIDTFNPGQTKVQYYWDFNVYSHENGVQVHESGSGEPFSYRMFVSNATGPRSNTFALLQALEVVPETDTPVKQWISDAIGKRMLVRVHRGESVNQQTGQTKMINKIDFKSDIKKLPASKTPSEATASTGELDF
jgi:hypothetical protein